MKTVLLLLIPFELLQSCTSRVEHDYMSYNIIYIIIIVDQIVAWPKYFYSSRILKLISSAVTHIAPDDNMILYIIIRQ